MQCQQAKCSSVTTLVRSLIEAWEAYMHVHKYTDIECHLLKYEVHLAASFLVVSCLVTRRCSRNLVNMCALIMQSTKLNYTAPPDFPSKSNQPSLTPAWKFSVRKADWQKWISILISKDPSTPQMIIGDDLHKVQSRNQILKFSRRHRIQDKLKNSITQLSCQL